MKYKIAVVLLLVLSISGCATVGSYQSACEQEYSKLSDIVACLKKKIASDSRASMKRDARVKLYLLKADQLVQYVQQGKLSEIDARVALQELYVRLKRDEQAEIQDIIANLPKRTNANCRSFGASVNCTSTTY